jgi:hypothetical protein
MGDGSADNRCENTGDKIGNARASGVQPGAALPLQGNPGEASPGAGHMPYVAPAVVFRSALEAVAANCYGAPGKAELTDCIVGNS